MSRSAAARSPCSAPGPGAAGGAPVVAAPPPGGDSADLPRRGGRLLGLLLALEALRAAPGALDGPETVTDLRHQSL